MQATVKHINAFNKTFQFNKVNNNQISALKKVTKIVSRRTESNFSLLKRFIKELQLQNDNSLKMYNREVI